MLLANLISLAYTRFRPAKNPAYSRSLESRHTSLSDSECGEVLIKAESTVEHSEGNEVLIKSTVEHSEGGERGGSSRNLAEDRVLSVTKGTPLATFSNFVQTLFASLFLKRGLLL